MDKPSSVPKMKIEDFTNQCSNHRSRVNKQLIVCMRHILEDESCRRVLNLNHVTVPIELQLIKEIRFLFLKALVRHMRPTMRTENKEIINIVRRTLRI